MTVCPTTRFEVDALRYLKYELLDECGQIDPTVLGTYFVHYLDNIGKVLRNTDGSIAQVFTPSNVDVLIFAYKCKGKHRKVAQLRRKVGCSLPPVGFESWEQYEEANDWDSYWNELD